MPCYLARDIPAFAFGFAVMAMFWLGHVRWRGHAAKATDVDLADLTLVFLTLVYVQPLRAMAAATGLWFTAPGIGLRGSLTACSRVRQPLRRHVVTMRACGPEALRRDQLDREGRTTPRAREAFS